MNAHLLTIDFPGDQQHACFANPVAGKLKDLLARRLLLLQFGHAQMSYLLIQMHPTTYTEVIAIIKSQVKLNAHQVHWLGVGMNLCIMSRR